MNIDACITSTYMGLLTFPGDLKLCNGGSAKQLTFRKSFGIILETMLPMKKRKLNSKWL